MQYDQCFSYVGFPAVIARNTTIFVHPNLKLWRRSIATSFQEAIVTARRVTSMFEKSIEYTRYRISIRAARYKDVIILKKTNEKWVYKTNIHCDHSNTFVVIIAHLN